MSRRAYARGVELLEDDVDPDPLRQFARWGGDELGPVALATATPEGAPSLRMVLLKGADEQGLTFFSNYESRKGRDLAANPRAALLFNWDPLGRQVRVAGSVERLGAEESDAYFVTRPAGAQAAARGSRQSAPLASRDELEEAARRAGAGERPDWWGGYVLRPRSYEFWQHREDRLHDRLRYEPEGTGWRIVRLAP